MTNAPAHQPPDRPSDEADVHQLRLAKDEGAKYLAALDYMVSEVADTGGKVVAGDYLVAFAQERAEGMYHLNGGALRWVEADEGTNCHIEISVLDAVDHRFIPHLQITCTILQGGKEVATFQPAFLWHPGLYHYGQDIALPGSGTYDLRVAIEPPTFPRHDKVNGQRYAERVETTFAGVRLTTGRE